MWWPETAEGGRKWTQLWLELYNPLEDEWAGFKLLEHHGMQPTTGPVAHRPIEFPVPTPLSPAVGEWRRRFPQLRRGEGPRLL